MSRKNGETAAERALRVTEWLNPLAATWRHGVEVRNIEWCAGEIARLEAKGERVGLVERNGLVAVSRVAGKAAKAKSKAKGGAAT